VPGPVCAATGEAQFTKSVKDARERCAGNAQPVSSECCANVWNWIQGWATFRPLIAGAGGRRNLASFRVLDWRTN
jgi:hypothetical protein